MLTFAVQALDGDLVIEAGDDDLAAASLCCFVDGQQIAVGDEGTALERSSAGAWTVVPLEVSGQSLRAVVRSERYVYLAGTGGVVLRHVLLDGN